MPGKVEHEIFYHNFANKTVKILFLLKRNLLSGGKSSPIAKSGLLNSAAITAGQLKKHLKVHTEVEVCVDANEIDKFLHLHRPKICILEALWCTPQKAEELSNLHPRVIFIVLIHSEVPFLANEGNAISWIKQYNEFDRVYPAFNSQKTFEHFLALGIIDIYLPNIYLDVEYRDVPSKKPDGVLDCGCFGAVRPFKNQLIQAMAAIVFADRNGWRLRFHMNTSRTEQGGDSPLKNIRALFEGNKHELVEHGWMDRQGFFNVIRKMDLGLQVSLNESYNITAADFVHENVPIVVGKTIDWMPSSQQADPENLEEIVSLMEHSLIHRRSVADKSVRYLRRYNKRSLEAWDNFLSNHR